MKNVFLASTTALALVWAAPAVSQSQLPALLEGLEAMAPQMDTLIEYSNKVIGSDSSVEYTDLRIMEDAENGSVFSIDWLRVTPSADVPGQITITMSPNANALIQDSGMEPLQIDVLSDGITATLDNMIPGAGGDTAETWNYVLDVPTLQITASGDNPIIQELNFTVSGLTSMSSFSPATQTVMSDGGLAALIFAFDITDPSGGKVAENGNVVDMDYRFGFDAVSESEMPEYFKGLRNAYFEFLSGAQSIAMQMSGPDAEIDMTGQTTSTSVSVDITDGIFNFSTVSGVSNYQINTMQIEGTLIPPFAIVLTAAEMAMRLPLINAGNVEEASVKMVIENLIAPESLLAMIDPGQTIPRSPINVNIDVAANVTSRIDWDNPDASFDSGNPSDIAEIQDITIRQFLISAAGAEVTVSGDAVIDNAMGFPFPTGMVTITAKGVQTLVNALVQLGLVPQQEAGMMMGMMMGLARSEGNDHYVSDVEFSPNGVTANGSPLPF